VLTRARKRAGDDRSRLAVNLDNAELPDFSITRLNKEESYRDYVIPDVAPSPSFSEMYHADDGDTPSLSVSDGQVSRVTLEDNPPTEDKVVWSDAETPIDEPSTKKMYAEVASSPGPWTQAKSRTRKPYRDEPDKYPKSTLTGSRGNPAELETEGRRTGEGLCSVCPELNVAAARRLRGRILLVLALARQWRF